MCFQRLEIGAVFGGACEFCADVCGEWEAVHLSWHSGMSFFCDGCGEFERFMRGSDRMHGGGEGKACCE